MYKLTQKREEKAAEILGSYQKQMAQSDSIDCSGFEMELRKCWGLGYRELKGIVIDMSRRPEYERMAAYYMQNQNALGPVSEFKGRLGQLYGVKRYSSKGAKEGREAYWSKVTGESQDGL